MAEFLAAEFVRLGGEATVHEVLPGRPNVYGRWTGTSGGWRAVDIHTDTVGVEQMEGDPFGGEIAGRRVHGRGSVDTKASLAVVLALLEEVSAGELRLGANLLILATVDEEVEAQGAPAGAAWMASQAITAAEMTVAEPTNCRPVVGHKGALRMRFSVEGVSSHSSIPDMGRNAILGASSLANAFAEEHARLAGSPHPLLGPGTLTVTRISGGRGDNVVPDECRLVIDRRLTAGEVPESIAAGLAGLAAGRCALPVTAETLKAIPPFLQDGSTAWLRALARWSECDPGVVPYGTNAWAYAGVAEQRVVIGPGSIEQAHGRVEWVDVSELARLERIYRLWWQSPIGGG